MNAASWNLAGRPDPTSVVVAAAKALAYVAKRDAVPLAEVTDALAAANLDGYVAGARSLGFDVAVGKMRTAALNAAIAAYDQETYDHGGLDHNLAVARATLTGLGGPEF